MLRYTQDFRLECTITSSKRALFRGVTYNVQTAISFQTTVYNIYPLNTQACTLEKCLIGSEVLTEVKMSMLVLWVVQPWRRRQHVSPKRWYRPTSQYGVTTQKTNIDRELMNCVRNFVTDIDVLARSEHHPQCNSYCWAKCCHNISPMNICIQAYLNSRLVSM
jgi:hypothetical protein